MNPRTASDRTDVWATFSGPNLGYMIEKYEQYCMEPHAVDEETRNIFDTYGPPPSEGTTDERATTVKVEQSTSDVDKLAAAWHLTRNLREYGHLQARVNPLQEGDVSVPLLNPASYGLTKQDLDSMQAKWILGKDIPQIRTASDAISYLCTCYTGAIAYEFMHVYNQDEREWLTNQVESNELLEGLSVEQERALLEELIAVEEFEKFLHRTFVGQKRFSIEGVDLLVPMLNYLIRLSTVQGATSVMMGMAHRGRLNVLAHVLGKKYELIFSEFHAAPNKQLVPSEGSMGINYGWTGDVKYHLGAKQTVAGNGVAQARLVLANNPSHLEFVDPVIEGFSRAAQEQCGEKGFPVQDVDLSIPILVHGDAAFSGEGVVAETLNLSELAGYHVGGTIHIITNNQLGFTAEPEEGRSTRYASDLAKGYEIPIVHVNGDDPEACMAAVQLAWRYRKQFHKDFLIDLVGYRKWGHNETDDPTTTQPILYDIIAKHQSARVQYETKLLEKGVMTKDDIEALTKSIQEKLHVAHQQTTMENGLQSAHKEALKVPIFREDTSVALHELHQINEELLTFPDDFAVQPKLQRILMRRKTVFDEQGAVDWAHAEALAFATILADGTDIRMTGQDSERGTFGQRHLMLHDVHTGAKYSPLHGVSQAKSSFSIYNSPLSEASVIGYEYGYSIESPHSMVIWEAQFGDFVNAGQVLIDQFVAPGFAKWGQRSSLVMLLPHGYEGQGPEHSSARLERFLQLSAQYNWRVVYPTSASQYFHLLRQQAMSEEDQKMPLIVMTPKGLLRNPRTASAVQFFTDGHFYPVLQEPLTEMHSESVERVILCSGKVAVDLSALLAEQEHIERVAVLRVEQLYPFPYEDVQAALSRYAHLKEVVWLQEEPQNMGAWTFVQDKLRSVMDQSRANGAVPNQQLTLTYVGRNEQASPAEGIAGDHQMTQSRILSTAIHQEIVVNE